MSLAAAKSQRAPSRRGPPTIGRMGGNGGDRSVGGAYGNGFAMTNKPPGEGPALLAQITQNDPATGPPFRGSRNAPPPPRSITQAGRTCPADRLSGGTISR